MQDCWVAILDRLDQFRWNGSFAGWAIAVSKNVCVDSLRAEKRNSPAVRVPLASVSELAADGPDPLDEVRRQQARPIIDVALSRLSDRERDALSLWTLMGRDLSETAAALGVTRPRLRLILARGMSKLRRIPQMRALLMDWMGED